MSKATDQIFEPAPPVPSALPSAARAGAASAAPNAAEGAIAIALAISVLGIVFSFALGRFGWQGGLIAVWPALTAAGGAGCACQEIIRRLQRTRLSGPKIAAAK